MAGEAEKREQHEKALAWLNEHWPEPRICPICGDAKWLLTDLVEIPVFSSSRIIPGDVYPAIQLVSEKCGYSIYFNAVIAGIVESKPKEMPQSQPRAKAG